MPDGVLDLLSLRQGHFLYESGHHGRHWLDLETLFLRPERVEPLALRMADALRPYRLEVVCGPLVEGAFVGLSVARSLGVVFTYSERFEEPAAGLYPYVYRLPAALRTSVRGKRVAIVNDVINAGSAVGRTFDDLVSAGAVPVVIGALLILGDWTRTFVADHDLGLEALASLPNDIWQPDACPLCVAGIPMECRVT